MEKSLGSKVKFTEETINKIKVLFFAEGATLAHVARPLVLAQRLDAKFFEATLCRPQAYSKLTENLPFKVLDLDCQDASVFSEKLDRGSPLYDFDTLCRYVATDLALIDQVKPDIIVGDFRLSLSVSARLRSIPYITICDAYWSPERALNPPIPDLGFTRFIPTKISESLFRKFAPFAFKLHARPLERLRSRFNLPSLGYDLRRCYTDADLRLFANFPALFPEVRPNAHADFIGPITWSPKYDENLDFLEGSSPLTYITMGSSGNPDVIVRLLPILEKIGSRIVVATAGKALPAIRSDMPSTFIFDFLPGTTVCQKADLVICNGGSPTTSQALNCGVPVIGIAQNMDQLLNMKAIVDYGAGILVRSDKSSFSNLDDAIKKVFHSPQYRNRSKTLAESLPNEDPAQILERHIRTLCSAHK